MVFKALLAFCLWLRIEILSNFVVRGKWYLLLLYYYYYIVSESCGIMLMGMLMLPFCSCCFVVYVVRLERELLGGAYMRVCTFVCL